VPIVVAVNKIDVPDADPNRVRSELSGEGLQPEEWGGTTQFSDVSAREAQNLDDLLEKVLLVADAELELTANPTAEASGPIIESGAVQDLNLVLKGDVVGSVEAAVSELGKIQHPEVRVNVIHQGVGGITEGDIMLASASGATVVGFNVRPNAEARALAEREGV